MMIFSLCVQLLLHHKSKFFDALLVLKIIKSNLHYTDGITPKRVTSSGAHFRSLAPGQHSSEATSQHADIFRRERLGQCIKTKTKKANGYIDIEFRNMRDLYFLID